MRLLCGLNNVDCEPLFGIHLTQPNQSLTPSGHLGTARRTANGSYQPSRCQSGPSWSDEFFLISKIHFRQLLGQSPESPQIRVGERIPKSETLWSAPLGNKGIRVIPELPLPTHVQELFQWNKPLHYLHLLMINSCKLYVQTRRHELSVVVLLVRSCHYKFTTQLVLISRKPHGTSVSSEACLGRLGRRDQFSEGRTHQVAQQARTCFFSWDPFTEVDETDTSTSKSEVKMLNGVILDFLALIALFLFWNQPGCKEEEILLERCGINQWIVSRRKRKYPYIWLYQFKLNIYVMYCFNNSSTKFDLKYI